MQIDRELFEQLQEDDFEVRDRYTGRGMYGATCFAVTGQVADLVRLLGTLPGLAEDQHGPAYAEQLLSALSADACSDSMGTDMVFYFPGVTVALGERRR